jgi:hypothetical protein
MARSTDLGFEHSFLVVYQRTRCEFAAVVDQTNYRLSFGYSFADLQDPIKNLHLGVAIMARQIDRHGKLFIPVGESGVYWSTLHPGGKHDKSAAIMAHTRMPGGSQ